MKNFYGISPKKIVKSDIGAGSDTFFVFADERYVLKFPSVSEMNNPRQEPDICNFLFDKGLPVSKFLPTLEGEFVGNIDGRTFHLQKFIEGKCYAWHSAPKFLMEQMPRELGKIHTALSEYPRLNDGIGEGFFKTMTPMRAAKSYENSLITAEKLGEKQLFDEIKFRIGLMERLPHFDFDVNRLSVKNTHGDYFISQIICGDDKISAIIDWTTACAHPVVWEITRSFVYAEPTAKDGVVCAILLAEYAREYMSEAELNSYDKENLMNLFYYQIAVCDYYNQYFTSNTANKKIYLEQAVFSTKLLRYLDKNLGKLNDELGKLL